MQVWIHTLIHKPFMLQCDFLLKAAFDVCLLHISSELSLTTLTEDFPKLILSKHFVVVIFYFTWQVETSSGNFSNPSLPLPPSPVLLSSDLSEGHPSLPSHNLRVLLTPPLTPLCQSAPRLAEFSSQHLSPLSFLPPPLLHHQLMSSPCLASLVLFFFNLFSTALPSEH